MSSANAGTTPRKRINAAVEALRQAGVGNVAVANEGASQFVPAPSPVFSIRERTEFLTNHANENGDQHRFPGQRELGWYSRDLQGVPFVVVSEPIYKTQNSVYGPQDVAQAQVRLYDWERNRETESKLVTFTGKYLVNQLHDMTPNELVGSCVWTIARNGHMPLTPQGVHPLMLAAYDPTKDTLPADTF